MSTAVIRKTILNRTKAVRAVQVPTTIVSAAWGKEGGPVGAAGYLLWPPTATKDQCVGRSGISLPGRPGVTRPCSSLPKLRLSK